MKELRADYFEHIIKEVHMKPRFKRDLKYTTSVEGLSVQDWQDLELLPIWNKSRKGGLLFLQPSDRLYVVPFELGSSTIDSSGRSKPVVCDLCYTWRTSAAAGYVTFYPDPKSNNTTSVLGCYDLRCSQHARTKTAVSIKSRAQLREDLDDNDRVARLKQKLQTLVETLGLEALRVDA